MMNICTAVNSRYVKYLCVMLASLFENNKENEICVYILHNDLTISDMEQLSAYAKKSSQSIIFKQIETGKFDRLPFSDRIPIESYFRLLIPEILTDLDRVLYLDVDLIINSDVSNFYYKEFNGNYAVVCKDMLFPVWDADYQRIFDVSESRTYFNAGVMLWNIERIKEDYNFDKFISVAQSVRFELPHHDQSLLNACFFGNVFFEDPRKWNYIPAADFRNGFSRWDDVNAGIIHFATVHPWDVVIKPLIVNKWWEYAKYTPYYTLLLCEQVEKLENSANERAFKEMQRVEVEAVLESMLSEAEHSRLKERSTLKNIIIYGMGHMAQKLIELMTFEGIDDRIVAAIDSKKAGSYRNVKIYNDFSFLGMDDDYTLVVTPTYKKNEVISGIQTRLPKNVKMVTLLDFLCEEPDEAV